MWACLCFPALNTFVGKMWWENDEANFFVITFSCQSVDTYRLSGSIIISFCTNELWRTFLISPSFLPFIPPNPHQGLPWWLSGKEPTCQCRRHRFDPWVRKIPWRRRWQPTPVLLPRKFYGQRRLVNYSPRGCKALDMTESLNNDQ